MSINTDSIIDISSGGINYGKIGISKTLNSLDLDEVFDSVYCSASCQTLCAPKQSYNAPSAFYEDVTAPLTFVSEEYGRWNYGNQEICYNLTSGADNSDDPLYARIIWLYSENSFNININSDNASGYSLVTQLNAQQWDIDISDLSEYNTWANRPRPTAFTDTNIEFMPYFKVYIYEESDTAHSGTKLSYGDINPYLIYKFNDKICITSLWIFETWRSQGLKYVQGDTSNYAQSDLFQTYDKSSRFSFDTAMAVSSPIKTWGLDSYYDFYGTDYTEDYIMYFHKVNSTEWHYFEAAPQNLNALNTWVCRCGFFFKTDKRYKPIISGGYVTGYTDDLTAESDFDNYTGTMQHDVPDTPGPGPGPEPGGDEDNDDPVNTAGAPFAAGLCHYYALTAGSTLLGHISEALGTWDIENTHKDLYKNLVSCKLIKPPAAIPTTGSEPFTIYGVKPQYQGADITLPVVSGNPDASFGPYTIDRKFGDFRDYAPYTRVSIYLPYCGWCDLPSHVVGRSVSVHYYTDIIAATCKAVVFCSNNIIAEAAGVIGLDIPFVADNVGAKMQAVTAGMIAALGGGIQLGAGIGTMVSTKSGSGAKAALSGASQYLSGYSQMAMAFNENTTEISGKNGDGCCLSGATNIIIKIVRPKKGSYTTAPYTPPGYGHSIGYVSQKQVRVSTVSGLLIADNVDTSGISGATEAERAEIKRVLETGLIVNSAP